jgi:hypothetical protein
MNPTLRTALTAWCLLTGGTGSVIRSERGDTMSPVSIVNCFALAYRAVGVAGCSSHCEAAIRIVAGQRANIAGQRPPSSPAPSVAWAS